MCSFTGAQEGVLFRFILCTYTRKTAQALGTLYEQYTVQYVRCTMYPYCMLCWNIYQARLIFAILLLLKKTI